MRPPPSGPNARRRARLWPWLGLALLWAQGLGLVHRIAHAPRPPAAATIESAAVARAAPGPGTLADLLGGHGHDPAECRLFDQASSADLLAAAVPPTGADLPGPRPPAPGAQTIALAATIHALPRGPPLHA